VFIFYTESHTTVNVNNAPLILYDHGAIQIYLLTYLFTY